MGDMPVGDCTDEEYAEIMGFAYRSQTVMRDGGIPYATDWAIALLSVAVVAIVEASGYTLDQLRQRASLMYRGIEPATSLGPMKLRNFGVDTTSKMNQLIDLFDAAKFPSTRLAFIGLLMAATIQSRRLGLDHDLYLGLVDAAWHLHAHQTAAMRAAQP